MKVTTKSGDYNLSHYIITFILIYTAVLNFNTLSNQYALDDEMVIAKNMALQQGLAGIPKILTTDAYQSYLDLMGANSPLTGGRYRPLSIVSFAIEQQLFGDAHGTEYLNTLSSLQQIQVSGNNFSSLDGLNKQFAETDRKIVASNHKIAGARHAMQVIYFMLVLLALWYLLSNYIFADTKIVALAATLLFACHPIHTEVIANLKSRDEIFSMLFILLTLIFVFRYHDNKTAKNFTGILISFVLALLSKEYALLLPVIAAVAIILYRNKTIQDLRADWFYAMSTVSIVFLYFRYSIIGNSSAKAMSDDLINNPYALAGVWDKLATKVYVCLEYVKLLFVPYRLSSDYSFNQIPYVSFANVQVWVSILFFTGLLGLTGYLLYKKNKAAFPLLFFLLFFFLINNLLFEIGATMGERLIFHSSLGFCMLVAMGIAGAVQKFPATAQPKMVLAITALFVLPYSYKTINRNPDWKDNFTLFTRDVITAPNSALTNCNAGSEYFNKGYFAIKDKKETTHADSAMVIAYADTALVYLKRAIAIYPRYTNAYMNCGICYLFKGDLDNAAVNWRQAARLFNGVHPTLATHARVLLNKALSAGYNKDYTGASKLLEYACELDPTNVEIWNNLAGSHFAQGNFKRATETFKKAIELNPSLTEAQQGLLSAENFLKLEEDCKQQPNDKQVWLNSAKIFAQFGFSKTAYNCYQHILSIDPGNAIALQGSAATQGRENKK
ncbi:MAG TPA: tetratricopeptide repeat protein [Chitinophagales bacterium]|nr:tetratricopeptide repeat protein [Chitinophagales bacterium]